MESLWPKIEQGYSSPPIDTLKKQGEHLETISNKILTYDIDTGVFEDVKWSTSGKAIKSNFYIHAPHLNNYKYLLLYIIHDFMTLYPIHIGSFDREEVIPKANDKQEFEEMIAEILGSEKTKHIINTLYTRSQPKPQAVSIVSHQ